MKKLTAFSIIMLLLFASLNICVFAEGDLKIDSTGFKTGQAYSPYSDFVKASGGEKPYTYSSGTLPKGLSLDPETGEISGTPTVNAQFRNITFSVTDATGETVSASINMYINPRLVDFRISNYNYTYNKDEVPYRATLECITPGVSNDIFSVYYGSDRQTEVYNAGQHSINISLDPGYRVRNVFGISNEPRPLSDYALNVYINQTAEISVESTNHIYTGEPYAADVTTVPSDLSYEVTYRKQGETEYTSQAPSEVGMYSVLARTTDSNYAERQATGTITIGYQVVQFNIEAEDSYTYNGNPQSPTVTAEGEIPADSWQVKYRNTATDEITETAPTNAGTYEIIIDFGDNPYEAEIPSANTFTIKPMPVDFNVTAEHTVIQDGTSFDIEATPIDNALITTDDYYMCVVDAENHEFPMDQPRDKVGKYKSKVKVTNPNFVLREANVLDLTVKGGCNFEVEAEKTEIVYGDSFDITVIAKNSVLHDYSVALIDTEDNPHMLSEISGETGDHHDEAHWGNTEPLDVGEYTIDIDHEDNEHNFIGEVTGSTKFTVVPLEVNFKVTAAPDAIAENSGDKFTFSVEASTDLINADDYTVVIKDESGNEYAADSTNLAFGNYTADIKINDGVENFEKGTVTSNTFRVARGLANFNITANPSSEITYGEKFTLNVDTIPEMQESDYKITVLDTNDVSCDLAETLDVGDYKIKAEVLNDDFAIGTVTAPSLKVNQLPITFTVEGDNVEEGNLFNITASPSSPLVQDDDYRIEIMNPDTHEVYQLTDILPRGIYATKITVTNPNFMYDGSSEISIQVLKKTIDFEIEANQSEITYGEKFNLTITPSEFTGYTVSLVDNNEGKHSIDDILDVGEYTVLIEYDGEDYEVGECTELTLTVNPAQVVFTVPGNTEFDYVQGVTRTVEVTNEAGVTDYTVQYKLNGNLSDNAEMPGEYEIVVTVNNPNYTAAAIEQKLIIRDTSVMNRGNSPAAMILQYGGENAEQLLEQFRTDYTIDAELNGITDTSVYNDTIWNDIDNLDLDPSAVFVRKFTEFQDPGLTYTNSEGETVTINGEIEGSDSINPKARAIYDIVYRYNGIERVRKLVVLGSKTADANNDRYVNSIDANVIRTLIGKEPETMAEKILYYRICDLDQDGSITQEDVNVVNSRFETPINEYYPWVVK